MSNLFNPPPKYELPLVKGQDLVVDFKNKVNGVLTDYDAGVEVDLIVDTDPVLVAAAVIDGYHAVARIESEVSDTIKSRLTWRCVVRFPTSPEVTDRVPVNGTTARYDGK